MWQLALPGALKAMGWSFGTAATLTSLFWLGFTFGFWDWEPMVRIWPTFALVAGIIFLELLVGEGPDQNVGTRCAGCAAMIVGVAGLASTLGCPADSIVKHGPLYLVRVGGIALSGAVFQGLRQD